MLTGALPIADRGRLACVPMVRLHLAL